MLIKAKISGKKSNKRGDTMQNKYFGDTHDFYKYYFLKKITKDYSLGIHWCLVPDEENKKDRNKMLSEKERIKDPPLYEILTKNKSRDVKYIEKYFPQGTKFYKKLLADYVNDYEYETKSLEILKSQDVIFFDPDNGIEVSSTNNRNKYKYVSYNLLLKFWNLGKSLIIYQHGGRINGQTDGKIRTLYKLVDKTANVVTVKRGNVTYICFIQGGEHYIIKDELVMFRENIEYQISNWKGTGDIAN
jgi:hypothetical protein